MNKEETQRAIEVMQAFVDGKRVESKMRDGESWFEVKPGWNFVECEYRIAPEPEHIQIIKRLVNMIPPWDHNRTELLDYLKREGY